MNDKETCSNALSNVFLVESRSSHVEICLFPNFDTVYCRVTVVLLQDLFTWW